jgi:hypothetical protein
MAWQLPMNFDPSDLRQVREITIENGTADVESEGGTHFLFFRNATYESGNHRSISELASWLSMDGVGIVTGKCISTSKKNIYAGAIMKSNGDVLFPYRGEVITEPGYMAITQIAHNISIPDYNCFMVRPEVWKELHGFDRNYHSFAYQVYDFSLRAANTGWRAVFNPHALFVRNIKQNAHVDLDQANDKKRFCAKWSEWLQNGDPYYSPNLSQQSTTYELLIPE